MIESLKNEIPTPQRNITLPATLSVLRKILCLRNWNSINHRNEKNSTSPEADQIVIIYLRGEGVQPDFFVVKNLFSR